MPRTLEVRPQVDIAAKLGAGTPAQITIDNKPVPLETNALHDVVIDLVPAITGEAESQVQINLWVGESSGYRIYAWTLGAGEASDPWDETVDHQSCSRKFNISDSNVRIQAALVANEEDAPLGPPDPGSSTTIFKVRVRKAGGMPI